MQTHKVGGYTEHLGKKLCKGFKRNERAGGSELAFPIILFFLVTRSTDCRVLLQRFWESKPVELDSK